jgi:hypothetical protein
MKIIPSSSDNRPSVDCLLSHCRAPFSSLFQSESERFDSFTHALFLSGLRESSINLNYTLADPEAYGLDDYEVLLYDTGVEDYPCIMRNSSGSWISCASSTTAN